MPRFDGTDENDHSVEEAVKRYVASGGDDSDAIVELHDCHMPSNVAELVHVHTIRWRPHMVDNATSIGEDLQLPPHVHTLEVRLMSSSSAVAVQNINGTISADSCTRLVHLSFDAEDVDVDGPRLDFAPRFIAHHVMVALETLHIDHCSIPNWGIKPFRAPRLTTLRCGSILDMTVRHIDKLDMTLWKPFTKFSCLRVIEVPWRVFSMAESDFANVLWKLNRDDRLQSLSLAPPRNPKGDVEPLVLPWSVLDRQMWKRRHSNLKLDVYLTLFLSLLERKEPIANNEDLEQLRLKTYILDKWAYSYIPVDAARAAALLGELQALEKPVTATTVQPIRRQLSRRVQRTPMRIVGDALREIWCYYRGRDGDNVH